MADTDWRRVFREQCEMHEEDVRMHRDRGADRYYTDEDGDTVHASLLTDRDIEYIARREAEIDIQAAVHKVNRAKEKGRWQPYT